MVREAERLEELSGWFKGKGGAVVAFSGGVDSSVLAKAAFRALGNRAVAVTFDSPLVPRSELENAKKVAKEIGVRHEIIEMDVLGLPGLARNPRDRCYLCKKAVSKGLKALGKRNGAECIVEGSTASDARLPRPGMKALEEAGIKSPLMELGIEKGEVRRLAGLLGLSTQNRPETACLATRIPFGEEITPEKLERIEEGEEVLRGMGLRQVRLRLHGRLARIEVGEEELEKALAARKGISEALKRLGFAYVALDIEGYRTGGMEGAS